MPVNPIPDGYHTVTPYLVVQNAGILITFLKEAFGGEELSRTTMPDGTILKALVRVGDSAIIVGEARGEFGSMPASIYLYVEDTDATYKRALAAGATSLMEPGDQFTGDRNAGVKDPCGNCWWIATHFEDVSAEEIERRAASVTTMHSQN